MNRIALASVIVALAGVASRDAYAQRAPDPAAQRRDLITRARAAANADNFTLALDLATRAAALEMTPSLRLFIAEQQARTGHWLDALSNASVCANEASADERADHRTAMVAACNELTEQARAHVAWVQVRVEGSLEGVSASMNGRSLVLSTSGPPCAVDPGPLVLEVFRDEHAIARREIVVTAGGSIELPVRILPRQSSPNVRVVSPPRETRPAPRARPSHAAPIALGAVGLGSTIAAATLFALREMAQGPCTPMGTELVCPSQADVPAAEAAIRYNLAADVTLGVGLAALAGSAIWFAIDRRAATLPGPRAAVVPSTHGAQLSIGWWL